MMRSLHYNDAMKFCYQCGYPLEKKIPAGDNKLRGVCTNSLCNYIHYINPKNIVATLPLWQDQVLLCKRAIEPRLGYWTLPAGFMECGETTEQGAIRETLEEAGACIKLTQLYRVYDLPYINQVYIFYMAQLTHLEFKAGEESLDVQLFNEADIPWNDMAFTVVRRVLEDFFAERKSGVFSIQNKTLEKFH